MNARSNMDHRLVIRLTLALAVLLSSLGVLAQDASDDLLNAIKSGWNVLQQLDELECQYTIKSSEFDPKQGSLRPNSTVLRIDRKPGFFRETIVTKDVTGIFSFNPNYCFSIGMRESKGAYLTRVTRTEPGIINPDVRNEIQFGEKAMKFYPLSYVHHQPGPDLLRNSTFKVTDKRISQNGLVDASVRFDVTIPGLNRPPYSTSIVLTLDPNKHYCVLGFRFDASMGVRKDIEFNRSVEELDGRMVCTRCELKNPPNKFHDVYEFVNYDFATRHPDQQYYLSHYGLPEPVGVTTAAKSTPLYVWLSIAAAAALVVAMVFGYVAKRRSAEAAAKTGGST